MSLDLKTLSRAALLAAVLMAAMLSTAQAQQNTDPALDIQNFQPAINPYGIFSVESSQVAGDLQISGGLMLNYASEPLVLIPENGDPQPLVDQQMAMDLLFNIGFLDRFDVGLALPIYLLNDASIGANTIEGATLGDLRLRPKFAVLDAGEDPVGLAFFLQIGFPTGDDAAFTSSGSFYARPGVIVDTKISRLLLSANVVANLQEERQFANLDVGSQLLYSAGAQYELVEGTFLIGGELFGSSSFDDFASAKEEAPLEGLVGLKYRTPVGINFQLAGGGGIVSGYGSPKYRVITGIRYAEFNDDWDEDGIVNSDDGCPRDPEDRDGFEDEDGCPDLDNDKDGLADADDTCPNDPEDKDGFEDGDGCPDPDNDKDGIADIDDKCPDEPGVASAQGCPDPDRDKDGIANAEDKCPDTPGIAKLQGCPETDKDGDGIPDDKDQCPTDPEDKDGFQDIDGCPDADNDNDGVCDPWVSKLPDPVAGYKKYSCNKSDACPMKPGKLAFDGCPTKKRVVIIGGEIKILEKVFFKTGSATIDKRSYSLLDEVAQTIIGAPGIKKIEVQGHTDDVGSDKANLKLSDDRAKSVRDYLVGKGVEPGRLEAKGYGETDPAKPITGLRGRALKEARGDNRRVQFKILERATKVIEEKVE